MLGFLTLQASWLPGGFVARLARRSPASLIAATAARERTSAGLTLDATGVGRLQVELVPDDPDEPAPPELIGSAVPVPTIDYGYGPVLAQPESIPLLSREEEVQLAREVQTLQRWRKVRAQLATAGPEPTELAWARAVGCSPEKLREQLTRSYAARQRLVESNLRLVLSVASKAARRAYNAQLQDVVQDGVLGLMTAADRFDPERGHRFSTYAVWWIRQAVRASLSAQSSRALAVPEDFARQLRVVQQASAALEQQLGRPPTDEELADELRISTKRVADLIERGRRAAPGASLDVISRGDGADRSILDSVRSSALEPAAAVSARMRRSEVLAYLQVRPPHPPCSAWLVLRRGRPPTRAPPPSDPRPDGVVSQERLTPREETVVRERFGLGESGAPVRGCGPPVESNPNTPRQMGRDAASRRQ